MPDLYSLGADVSEETGEKMKETLALARKIVAQRQADLTATESKPWNYLLETQRDALTRAKNLVEKDARDLKQLENTMLSALDSGDDNKVKEWFATSDTITDAGAARIFSQQVEFGKLSNTAAATAKPPTGDSDSPLNPRNWPWWVWLGIAAGGVYLASGLVKEVRGAIKDTME